MVYGFLSNQHRVAEYVCVPVEVRAISRGRRVKKAEMGELVVKF